MTSFMLRIAFILLLVSTYTTHAAVVVYEHLGATNPITEGWQRNQFGPSFSEGSVFESGTHGFDAWKIDDDHAGFGGDATQLQYRVNIADEYVTSALSDGWELTARIRIADDPNMGFNAAQSSIAFVLSINARIYFLDFATYTGTSVTILSNGTQGPQFNVGGNGYHEYKLSYDPALDSVAFRVDGLLLTSNLPGLAISNGNYIEWGSVAGADVGQGNWNRVAFSVPEPSSAIYLLLSAGFLLKQRRRTMRSANGSACR
jgi:hypothetical protein